VDDSGRFACSATSTPLGTTDLKAASKPLPSRNLSTGFYSRFLVFVNNPVAAEKLLLEIDRPVLLETETR
jgi:hypothetical protein